MNELEEALRPLIAEYTKKIFDSAVDDAGRFGKEMAEDMAAYLYRSYALHDDMARENLRDLKAQIKLLAIKHRIITQNVAADALVKALEIIARVALAALKINLPLP